MNDDDYLFLNDNPLAPPPETVTKLGDLNTEDAYLKTYKKLIRKPNQVLLPICVYIDGAVTGQFSDLFSDPSGCRLIRCCQVPGTTAISWVI